MKIFTKSILAAVAIASTALVACEEPKGADSNGGYGDLGGNLITIGSTRDVTYTECVLLGTVDFPKITSDHTYGIVYMEALLNPEFDYNSKLVYGGMSDKYDKEEYVCIAAEVNSSAADGKFEKQLVHLKPATTYYYRAYVRIGNNINYSSVESFTTVDPTPEITMSTVDATEILAVAATMNGGVNVGNLQDVNENQEYGFIFTPSVQLNDAEKLTYEYYKAWQLNHFETEDDFEGPREVTTTSNLNGRINCKVAGLIPGTVYYYRTFFKWNGKYFYSPEVKTLKTNGTDVITVGTNPVDEITDNSARLSATVPFEAIGLEVVDAGFMISKKYSNASEFNLKNAVPWGERYQNPDADIYFVETRCIDKDFEMFISGLEPETRYYVCGYLDLTDYLNLEEDETVVINGSIQQFVTEKIAQFRIEGEGDYPWIELADGSYASGNQGVSGSESKMVVTVIPNVGDYLCFDLKVSSESGYDQLYIKTGSKQLKYSGERQEKVRWRLNSGKETVVEFIYSKDGGTDVGEDRAVYNTAAKSNRFGTQDKPNKNVIRTWATTQEKSIQRISRPK